MSTILIVFMSKQKQFYYSFQAGICAAGGSIFGKLSSLDIGVTENHAFQYIVSSVFITLMLICNAAVWTFFVKALQESHSSFVPTLSVSATNYILSAAAGRLVFGEPLSLLWILGTALILSGLAVMASDNDQHSSEKTS